MTQSVEEYIFGFQIPVYHAISMECFQGDYNFCSEELNLFFCEASPLSQMEEKFPAATEVHY